MAAKYQTIADELRFQIRSGKYAAAAALPTEAALCQEYGVSRQTVRQALSLLVSDGLIQRRQGSGSRILHPAAPVQTPPATVAVVTTYISDYIFPSILREVEQVLSSHGYTPLLFSTQNRLDTERRILESLLTMPIRGILVEGSKTVLPNPNLDLYRQLLDREIPLVFLHGVSSNLSGVLSVLDDNRAGGRQLVEYLYGKGHRNIAGIFKNDDIQGLQRYEGFISALRDLGLPMGDGQVAWYSTETKAQFLESGVDPLRDRALAGCSAVVCYNDEIASWLIGQLLRQGVRIPEELAVVSFDNSHYSTMSPVPITSLSHGEYSVGKMSAQLLLRRMAGEECHSEKAPWTLIRRESG